MTKYKKSKRFSIGRKKTNKNLISSKAQTPIVLLERLIIDKYKQNLCIKEEIIDLKKIDCVDEGTSNKNDNVNKNKLISTNTNCKNYITIENEPSENKNYLNKNQNANSSLVDKESTGKTQPISEQEFNNESIQSKLIDNIKENLNTTPASKLENGTDSSRINLQCMRENCTDFGVSTNFINKSEEIEKENHQSNEEVTQDTKNINDQSNANLLCINISDGYDSLNFDTDIDHDVDTNEKLIRIDDADSTSINENVIFFVHEEEYDVEEDYSKKSIIPQTENELMDETDPLYFEKDDEFSIPSAEYSLKTINQIPLECPKCLGIYLGQENLGDHFWSYCGLLLSCHLCPSKFKQRRSARDHIKKVHADEVQNQDVTKIVDKIVANSKELRARGEDLLSTLTIRLPDFVDLHCRRCGFRRESIVDTYRSNCDNCGEHLAMHCSHCGVSGPATLRVLAHARGDCYVSGSTQPLRCLVCDFIAKRERSLADHLLLHGRQKQYESCAHCGRKFQNRNYRQAHEATCAEQLRKQVNEQQQQAVTEETPMVEPSWLSTNLQVAVPVLGDSSSDQTVETSVERLVVGYCQRCTQFFGRSAELCHTCGARLTFFCTQCKYNQDKLLSVQVHVMRQHMPRKHRCPRCFIMYSLLCDLEEHAKLCGRRRDVRCPMCDFVTVSEGLLRGHVKSRHPDSPMGRYRCSKCNATFTTQEALKLHERRYYDKSGAYRCDHCDLRTRYKTNLLNHLKNKHSIAF